MRSSAGLICGQSSPAEHKYTTKQSLHPLCSCHVRSPVHDRCASHEPLLLKAQPSRTAASPVRTGLGGRTNIGHGVRTERPTEPIVATRIRELPSAAGRGRAGDRYRVPPMANRRFLPFGCHRPMRGTRGLVRAAASASYSYSLRPRTLPRLHERAELNFTRVVYFRSRDGTNSARLYLYPSSSSLPTGIPIKGDRRKISPMPIACRCPMPVGMLVCPPPLNTIWNSGFRSSSQIQKCT